MHVAPGPEGFKVHLENIMLTDNYGKCHGLWWTKNRGHKIYAWKFNLKHIRLWKKLFV
jgi:hypothetical protein